jgi:hypothetical protein
VEVTLNGYLAEVVVEEGLGVYPGPQRAFLPSLAAARDWLLAELGGLVLSVESSVVAAQVECLRDEVRAAGLPVFGLEYTAPGGATRVRVLPARAAVSTEA